MFPALTRTVILLAAFGCAAYGQRSNFYFFVAPGAQTVQGHSRGLIQAGAGGEFGVGKGIGIGAEAGGLALSDSYLSSAVFTFSPNGYFHFLGSTAKTARFDPFVTGGYTAFIAGSVQNLFNLGGGLNYWFRPKLGLRLEVRDQIDPLDGPVHYWGVRFGLVF